MKLERAADCRESLPSGWFFVRLGRLFLALIFVSLGWGLVELSIGAYLTHFASERLLLRYGSLSQLEAKGLLQNPVFSPHRYLGYIPTPGFRKGANRHNALGYRGDEIVLPKPPQEYRIVCVGGSTTYTGAVEDYRLSYPFCLEEALHGKGFADVTVVNAGVSAWCSHESLINFQLRLRELEPDLLVVYHGVNDVTARLVWPREAYKADNSGTRKAFDAALQRPHFWEYSNILRILMTASGQVEPQGALQRSLSQLAETNVSEVFEAQVREGVYPSGRFKTVSAEAILDANKPVFFERNLSTLVTLAEQTGIQVVLASFAHSRAFAENPRASSAAYAGAIAEQNASLEVIAEHSSAHFFDFAAVFPEDRNLYVDGIHVNAEGASLKARLFADYLSESVLKSESPSSRSRVAE